MVKFSTWSLNLPPIKSTNVCGVMHFRSWCLPAVSGSAKGLVKSPIKSGSSVAARQKSKGMSLCYILETDSHQTLGKCNPAEKRARSG